MRYTFHPEARAEYYEAIAWYDDQRHGLGARFTEEVEETIEHIIEWPKVGQVVDAAQGVRRCLTSKFPYSIYYRIREDIVYIMAVMHTSRRPEYWQSRLKEDGPQS